MHTFRQCVQHYNGNHKIKSFTCLGQFLCMAFAQLTYRESLRDIEVCLHAHRSKLYHMGLRGGISRNTLANANKVRDWRLYANFAQALTRIACRLYIDEGFAVDLANIAYALDASTIDLCLSFFPRASSRRTKAAVKLHTLLDLRGNIPTFVHIAEGKLHDVNVLDLLPLEPSAFYIMDRGYLVFARLYHLALVGAFFPTRTKPNTQYSPLYSRPVDKSTGLKFDQTIMLIGVRTPRYYPEKLRCIKYYDATTEKIFVFLTNNFSLPALTIVDLYRCCWQVELFFGALAFGVGGRGNDRVAAAPSSLSRMVFFPSYPHNANGRSDPQSHPGKIQGTLNNGGELLQRCPCSERENLSPRSINR